MQLQQIYDILITKVIKMIIDFNYSSFFEDFNNSCNKVTKKAFKKGEIITTYIEKRNQMCIMLSRNSKSN